MSVPAVQVLDQRQQQADEARARHESGAAWLARQTSTTEFEGLDAAGAAKLASEDFPEAIARPASPPELPAGVTITGYPSDNAAQVTTSSDGRALMESTTPLAVETSRGRREAIDLSLRERGGYFSPVRSPVAVNIPKRSSGGSSLADNGVSLTPVDATGRALAGAEGTIDGAAIFYGGTGDDMDSAVKPTVGGFEVDAVLRSPRSPRTLYFRLGLPQDAAAAPAGNGNGEIDVNDAGHVIARLSAPAAQDASGWPVPVSMRLHHEGLISISLGPGSDEYQYPLEVDPTVEDAHLTEPKSAPRGNWEFHSEHEPSFGHSISAGGLKIDKGGEYQAGNGWDGYWGYETKGNSRIWELSGEDEAENGGAHVESVVELFYYNGSEQKIESEEPLSTEPPGEPNFGKRPINPPLCAEGGCAPGHGHTGNVAAFEVLAGKPSESGKSFSDSLYNAVVSLWEPEGTHATTLYNTTSKTLSPTIEGKEQPRNNVLGPEGGWLSHYVGAFETIAKDPGIGVEKTRLEYLNGSAWGPVAEHRYGPEPEEEDLCQGVQCFQEHTETWALPNRLPNGEDRIRYRAEEAMAGTESLQKEGEATVDVDTAKPHNVELNGLPAGNELSESEYTLEAVASDGENEVASSGVASIELYVNEHPIAPLGKAEGTCSAPTGECTADARFKLNGAELGAGHDAIVVVAKDRAGNEAREPFTVTVRHSTPVALGPGSVDLQSGDFALGATDVSMGQGLTVARTYSSRGLTLGNEGPMGPQWLMSMGANTSLTELVDGAVMLTASNGGETIFAPSEPCTEGRERKFESPPGDLNIVLSAAEDCQTKHISSYYLANPAARTKVEFTQPEGTPEGSKVWLPTVQEGAVATDTVTYAYQPGEIEVEGHEKKIIEPKEALAPVPAGVTCSGSPENWTKETNNGCRALTFYYATGTTAQGTGAGELGEYKGDLSAVYFFAYNPAPTSRRFEKIPVARYAYDTHGRLRAEWDPRVEPLLKTTYGYDPEGHITTLSPPGQEPWIMRYGTTAGDRGTGRVISVWRPPASAPLVLGGSPPQETGLPSLSVSRAKVGETVTLGSRGRWSNSPLTYSYQWEACNASGSECQPILGAVNPHYTITFAAARSYVGRTLEVQVTATNAAGSGTASSGPSQPVGGPTLPYDGEFGHEGSSNGQLHEPTSMAAAPNGDIWVLDAGNGRIEEFTSGGTYVRSTTLSRPFPDFGKLTGLAVAPNGDVFVTESCEGSVCTRSGQVEEFNEQGEALRAFNVACRGAAGTECEGALLGHPFVDHSGDVWVSITDDGDEAARDSESPYGKQPPRLLEEFNDSGERIRQISEGPYAVAIGERGGKVFVLTETHIIKEYTDSGKYLGQLALQLRGAAVGEVAIDAHGNFVLTGEYGSCATEFTSTGEYLATAGSYGAGSEGEEPGKCTSPWGVATGTHNDVLVGDATTDRLQDFSETAVSEYNEPQYGSVYPETQFTGEYATSIAVDPNGHVWVPELLHGDVAEFNEAGERIRDIGETGMACEHLCLPTAVAADGQGHVWVVDSFFFSQVDEFAESGQFEQRIRVGGTPINVAADAHGDVWVVESSCHCVQEFSSTGQLEHQFGEKGSGPGQFEAPYGIAVDAKGNVWVSDMTNSRIQEFSSTGTYEGKLGETGSGPGQLNNPGAIAFDPSGDMWVADTGNDRVQEFSSAGQYLAQFGTKGEGPGELDWPRGVAVDHSGRNIWVADTGNSRVQEWGIERPASPTDGSTVHYGVPLSGPSVGAQMGHKEVAAWGQEDDPVEATAITPPDEPQAWPATSYRRATVYYLDGEGRVVNTATPSASPYGSIATSEYSFFNDTTRTLTPDDRIKALESGSHSVEESKLLDTTYVYNGERGEQGLTEPGTELLEKKGPEHRIRLERPGTGEEKEEEARAVSTYRYDEECNYSESEKKERCEKAPGGEAYDLETETQSYAEPRGHNTRVEERTARTSYGGEGGLGWHLRAPTSVTTAPVMGGNLKALNLTHSTIYYTAHQEAGVAACENQPQWEGLICETLGAAEQSGSSPRDARTVYYSANEEAPVPTCQKHPEWAGLVCQTLPAKQPEDDPGSARAPKLPTSTTSYNIYDQPEVVTEEFSEATRTKTEVYDSAGRLLRSKVVSSDPPTDVSVPEVTYGYSETTGDQVTKSSEGITIEGIFDNLGRLTEYKDGRGSVAHYSYEEPEGLIKEVRDSSEEGQPYDEGKSYQRYGYDETTKQLISLEDSAFPGRPFMASYDAEGRLTSEVFPNAMCANYGYNALGEATQLEYIKSSDCSEPGAKVWYSEKTAPSIHGEALVDHNSLATTDYSYDQAGRLTEVQESPKENGCTVRLYAFEPEGGPRKSLTTREPTADGECASKPGEAKEEVQEHQYDDADRLIDPGTEYDPLDNTTRLPASDSGGGVVTSEYYVDNQVRSQSQDGKAVEYLYDPEGRTRTRRSGGNEVVLHYDGTGPAIAWESELEGTSGHGTQLKLTRNIPGLDGSLTATQENGGEPVILMHDLKGNVVGRCSSSPGAENPISTYSSTEFGVPTTSEPPKYSWLGAQGVSTERPSGVIVEGGTSYVPETGMTLQPEAVEPPGLPGGSGGGGAFISPEQPWVMQAAGERAAQGPGRELAREFAVAVAACEANPEACDPEGVFYGAQAWKWAEYFNEIDENLAQLGQNSCPEPSVGSESQDLAEQLACQGFYAAITRAPIEANDLFADKLEWCWEQVHQPDVYQRQGKWYVVSRTCYAKYSKTTFGGGYVVAESPHVQLCSSPPSSPGSVADAWYCPYDKRWWWSNEVGRWRG